MVKIKRGLLTMGIIAVIMGLLGCGNTKSVDDKIKENDLSGNDVLKTEYNIESFRYSYNNSFGEGSYSYEITEKENGYIFTYDEEYGKYGKLSCKIDRAVLERLEDICKNNNIIKCDGYNKSDPDVCDGDGFDLEIILADGKDIYASGSNCVPKGYSEFVSQIKELLNPYVATITEAARLKYISEPFGKLDTVMVNYNKNTPPKDTISFYMYQNDDGGSKFDYRITLKEDGFLPMGTYGGTMETDPDFIDYELIRGLIDKYDIIKNDMINEHTEGGEWYQLEFGFDNDKHISVMGTAEFDNYEAFREEILKYLFSLIPLEQGE